MSAPAAAGASTGAAAAAAARPRFVNHPGAKQAPAEALHFAPDEDKNPVLRGLPLVLASAIIARSKWLQSFFWHNLKLGQPKFTPGLDEHVWRLIPNVIPLSDGTPASQRILPFGPETILPQPSDLPGRFYSVADYHGLYSSGEATPLQVVEALLPLIRRDVSPPSKYAVAWLQTDVDAVLAAARASTERWAAKEPLGVLDGVPFGVKDDIDVEGFVSTMGMGVDPSETYFGTKCTTTAWPVRKMMEAGAIMMGKMNQHEIGLDTTGCNPTTGTPHNWYSKSHYPGGSSSGAASALSAGIVPIALGTDAGGSCRIPPAFCGVYGLKVTHNRLRTQNSSVCVVAPMASTVADLTIAYRTGSQPNPADPNQSLFATSLPPPPSSKKYIGICREWVAIADADVRAALDKVIAHLTSARMGYEVVDIQLPYLRQGQLAHTGICITEGADMARDRVDDPNNVLRPLSHPNRVTIAIGMHTPAVDYLKYGQIRQAIMAHLAWLFERYPGLLVVTPTTPSAGWPIIDGDTRYGVSDGNRTVRNMMYAWLANFTGCPAVSCPGGYVAPKHPAGKDEGVLPVGVMAMGEWGAEEQLLGFARDVEGYLNEAYEGGRRKPEEWCDVLGIVKGEERKE
ncbi:N-acylethanolamine amidohydrolase [Echria macrotheca]|uniref:N-acylethanolamine amidohydrolase n=1 Tax=Echria macrotheca TaxID=438768 RepID=A0AAJ0B6H2_9PEZI|nr:N-acylethanolamine amidohydrolase [Echria macrotheca]